MGRQGVALQRVGIPRDDMTAFMVSVCMEKLYWGQQGTPR